MILDINKLAKQYSKKLVLHDVTFSIARGEIVGLVGPNGSGKTTLLNILTGMLKATSGSFKITDRTKLGMAISRKGFFNDMSVTDNLMLYARLMGADTAQVNNAMQTFTIDFGKVNFGKLSAGMKQRVALTQAFMLHNDLILLDEPTNHLDIDSILNLRTAIVRQKELKSAILITSHIFSDLEKVCDRILFLKQGHIVKDTTLHELIDTYGDIERAYIHYFQEQA